MESFDGEDISILFFDNILLLILFSLEEEKDISKGLVITFPVLTFLLLFFVWFFNKEFNN